MTKEYCSNCRKMTTHRVVTTKTVGFTRRPDRTICTKCGK